MTAEHPVTPETISVCSAHPERDPSCPHCNVALTSNPQDPGERRFMEARQTVEAGRPKLPIVGCNEPYSAGLLLYSYVYEARWAGLRTAETCPRWRDLPQQYRDEWEDLARQLGRRSRLPDETKSELPEEACKELMRRIYAAGVCSDTYRHKLIRTWFNEQHSPVKATGQQIADRLAHLATTCDHDVPLETDCPKCNAENGTGE